MRSTALAALCCSFLAACASSEIIRGEGGTIARIQAEPVFGGRYRVVVAPVIDKTDPLSEKSLPSQLVRLNLNQPDAAQLQPTAITAGLRDMLVTDLFGSDRFIVLERDAMNEVLVEQEFSQSAEAGDATRIPAKQLEGAELIVLAAITGFDAGVGGGAIPIPIPMKLGRNYDLGVLSVAVKRGFVSMDLRVVDARSGRILSSVAVEGRKTSWGLDFTGFFDVGYRYVKLPGLLTYFSNTPIEHALQKMVSAAVDHVAAHTKAR